MNAGPIGFNSPLAGVVTTNPARCRDCYRCVRVCPVKAVRIAGAQAQIVPELCIECASCVRACPQGAKVVRDDRDKVRKALTTGRVVAASVAPSVPAYFDLTSFAQIEAVLARLGFAIIEETSYGAEMVGVVHGELVEGEPDWHPILTSSCPVIVNLIESYYPDLLPHLAPIVSPMIAHGRSLRDRYGDGLFVVFIGPCVAKKGEIGDPDVLGAVDAAVTFRELEEWLDQEKVVFPDAEPLELLPQRANARLFPVEGGLVGTAGLEPDFLSSQVMAASGIETCRDILDGIRCGHVEARLIELMACDGGCINGPSLQDRASLVLSRKRVLDFAVRRQEKQLPARGGWPDLSRTYHDTSVPAPEFSEAEISAVLQRIDKVSPEDELDCGACGYDSCRTKAVAVLRGMAEATMCIPYMRSHAESLTHVVMDVTPDAILIVDRGLHIQAFSPSAEEMFQCRRAQVLGQPLSTIDPVVKEFGMVRDSGQPILNQVVNLRDDLVVEQSIVPVGGENLIVAILRDVTERERQRADLERLRAETLARSKEVIRRQMHVAHEIAGLLGETTADTKVLLTQLARLMEDPAPGTR